MTAQHDIIVVGAGPGGAAAAQVLARRGLDVLLLDKSNFPRDKTCGDGLTPRAGRARRHGPAERATTDRLAHQRRKRCFTQRRHGQRSDAKIRIVAGLFADHSALHP
ncbi:MAG: FAD-dependent monooxygenase [Chloroflexi bacterium]|nr:FAD-dependent monooxygenase [Chloroflexota bacterium]